jgi:hypothetical protein
MSKIFFLSETIFFSWCPTRPLKTNDIIWSRVTRLGEFSPIGSLFTFNLVFWQFQE